MSENKFRSQPADIAIVGMECIFPGAVNMREYWQNIVSGKDSITEIPHTHWNIDDYWDPDPKVPDKSYCKKGGFLPFIDFDPLEYGLAPKDIDVIDTAQLLSMKVAKAALKDAGYLDREFNRERASAIIGTTSITELATPLNQRLSYPIIRKVLEKHNVDPAIIESAIEQYRDSFPIWQENSFPGVLGNVISGRIANFLDFGGTNCVIDAACASSLGAIKMAVDSLNTGSTDLVITGGADTVNNIFMFLCFSKTPAFSRAGFSRPFDIKSDGILIGEGIGMVVMKRLKDAIRDKDRIYCVLKGIGSSSDGKKAKSIYQPAPEGQAIAIRQAYEISGISPHTIRLMEAHGTGTVVGDIAEISSMCNVYRPHFPNQVQKVALGSVKSQIGHTKACAGVAGLIKIALSIYHKVLPPIINIETPIPKMEIEKTPFYLNTETRPWCKKGNLKRHGACSAFGFGGTNFHAVLEEYTDEVHTPLMTTDDSELILFSAANAKELLAVLKKADEEEMAIATDFHHYARYNQHFFQRNSNTVVFIAKNQRDLSEKISDFQKHLQENPQKNYIIPNIAYYYPENSFSDAKIAVIFPGQGSQHQGMGKNFIFSFPFLQQELDEADEFRTALNLAPISDIMYPIPVFTDEAKQQQEELLRRTDNAQFAIGFVNLALYQLLQKLGLKADCFAGHSYGELSALYAAGVIDKQSYFQLSAERGRLMRECSEESAGAMAAIMTELAKAEALLAEFNQEKSASLVIANRNAPNQAVLSGLKSEIEQAIPWFEKKGFRIKPLAVSAAFHTKLMAPAVKLFGEFINKINLRKPEQPVYANSNAQTYPQDEKAIKSLLTEQLLNPVYFSDQIENMYQNGVRIFIEVGPGNVLTSLCRSILDKQDCLILNCNSQKRHSENFASFKRFQVLLAELIALHKINLNPAILGSKPDKLHARRKNSPVTLKINGANYLKQSTLHAPTREPKITASSQAVMTGNISPQMTMPVGNISSPATTTAGVFSQPAIKPIAEAKAERKTSQSLQTTEKYVSSPANLKKGKKMDNENYSSLDEFNSYRLKIAEVHEQFLQMQTEANRIYERMLFGMPVTQQMPMPAMPIQQMPMPAMPIQQMPIQQMPIQPMPMPAMPMPAMPIQPMPMPAMPMPAMPAQPMPQPKPSLISSMFEKSTTAIRPPSPSVTRAANAIKDFLVQIVAEKTGFPEDMISLDMDLENDLAVDSIRRVEILGAVQENFPDAPVIGPEQLGILKTLNDIVEYLGINEKAPREQAKTATTSSTAIKNFLISTVAEKTGFPEDMISLDMDLENDLAVDSIRRVEILGAVQEKFPQAPTIGPEQLGILKTLNDIITFLDNGVSTNTGQPCRSCGESNFRSFLISTVAEKTGFPEDMISLDMDLENDLAVDSIRRVEILGAMQERFPDAPAVGPEQLGILKTLADIINFLEAGKKKTLPN